MHRNYQKLKNASPRSQTNCGGLRCALTAEELLYAMSLLVQHAFALEDQGTYGGLLTQWDTSFDWCPDFFKEGFIKRVNCGLDKEVPASNKALKRLSLPENASPS